MAFKTFLNKLHLRSHPSSPDLGQESPPRSPSPGRSRPGVFDALRGRRRSNQMPDNFAPLFSAAAGPSRPTGESIGAQVRAWANQAGPLEQPARHEAARRMREVYDGKTDELSLSNLGLTSLPACLSKLNMSSLNVAGNRLEHLPELPPNLVMLVAANNNLAKLPRLPAGLNALSVNQNQLVQLPALPQALRICEASGNQLMWLDALPAGLDQLSVSQNKLRSLPPIPPGMKLLDASGNHLASIPELPRRVWESGHGLAFRADLRNNLFSNHDLAAVQAHLDATFAPGSLDRARLQFDPPVTLIPKEVPVGQQIEDVLRDWTRNVPESERPARIAAADLIYKAHLSGADRLSLEGIGLKSLPDCLSMLGITQLNLKGNQLESLPALPPHLTTLFASKNDLTTLPELPGSLVTLDISRNHFAEMPALPAGLKSLGANHNKLKTIGNLPATLQLLAVNKNRLTRLPALPPTLMALHANGNELRAIPVLPGTDWSTNYPSKFTADLRNNLFSEDILQYVQTHLDPHASPGSDAHRRLLFDAPAIPAEPPIARQVDDALAAWLFEAPAAERPARAEAARRTRGAFESGADKLNLSGLALTSLPGCLSKLQIGQLNLDENRLQALPPLPSGLTILSANNNRLSSLQDLPPTLLSLKLNDNVLSQLPPLPAGLKSLSAGRNTLRQLPPLPPRLMHLEAEANQLAELPSLPANLSILDVSGNRLTQIPILPSAFWADSPNRILVANLRQNRFSEADLRGFQAQIEARFPAAGGGRDRFVFDTPVIIAPQPSPAPRAPAIEPWPVATLKTKDSAKAAVEYWRAMNVPHAELVALRADMDRYMLQGAMTGQEFDQRHGAGQRTEQSGRAFFDANSKIEHGELRKAFGLLRNALPTS